MRKIGKLKGKNAKDIISSKIGVGFECLDRKMWDDSPDAYKLLGELGVKHARVQTGWNQCEQVIGKYDFQWLDKIVEQLFNVGVRPWFNLGYGNINHTDTEHPDAVG